MAIEYTTQILNSESQAIISSQEDYSVLFIVRGDISMLSQGRLTSGEKGTFFFLNPGESIQINWKKDALIARLIIESGNLHSKSTKQSIYLAVENSAQEKKTLNHTSDLLKNFWLIWADVNSRGGYGELGAYYTLMDDLLKHYCSSNILSQTNGDDYGTRMLRYIHMNYSNHISLDEIADRLYISTPTASRAFYETTGVKFGEYLRTLRLNKAKQLLEMTEDSITEIAMNVGFGSPSAMNKIFLKSMGMTPSEYRTDNRAEVFKSDIENGEVLDALLDAKEQNQNQKLTLNLSEVLKNNQEQVINSPSVTYQPPLLNVGIEKPVYHVFKLIGQLGKRVFLQTDNCIITGDFDGSEIRILMYNCQSPEADYYLLSEDGFRPGEVYQMFPSKSLTLNIKIEGLLFDGEVQVHQKVLNEEHGSVLHHWVQMGCINNLSREDLQYLKNVSIPKTVINEIATENSTIELDVELAPNEVRLICLRGSNRI